jgi:hypothetical protein
MQAIFGGLVDCDKANSHCDVVPESGRKFLIGWTPEADEMVANSTVFHSTGAHDPVAAPRYRNRPWFNPACLVVL